MTLELADFDAARRAPAVFADLLVGQPLWDHQLEVVRSAARYRVITAGRRAGKSRVFGVLALHQAFAVARSKVLIVSAGEVAARRLFSEIASLATGSPLLKGSVADESKSLLTLSNGSTIECVPASMAQVRSAEADLLIVDEAGFVAQEIWEAAEPTILARPGSRVLLCSSPWGRSDHFFRQLWNRGMRSPDEQVESWHWPSSVSPLVDEGLLEEIRERSSPTYFEREYLAVWTDGAGSYLTAAEVDDAVAGYELVDPRRAFGQLVVGGVDWGLAVDANALVLLGVSSDGDLNVRRHATEPVFFIAHITEEFRMQYSDFIGRVVDVIDPERGGFHAVSLASECNGVGAMPSASLFQLAYERRTGTVVAPVHTTARRKQSAWGTIKGLLQQGRLVLPRHPALLRQLASLEYEISDAGNIKIEVPSTRGHDDIADALAGAVSCIRPTLGYRPRGIEQGTGAVLTTSGGTAIYERPRCASVGDAFVIPQGRQHGDGW